MSLSMPYGHLFPQKRRPIDTLFIETRVKLDGAFDMNTTRKRLHLPGSLNIDMMIALKKLNPKDDMLASHGLRSYLERYNLPGKLDISVQDMNKAYNEELAELMYDTAEYCVVDSLSCVRLEQKVNLFDSYRATAHLALCSISDAFIRAGGMKVKNVIYAIGRRLQCNYTENAKKVEYHGKFPGAVVFAPLRGLYQEVPTIALDFASLYPSIMRAIWISSETYLEDKAQVKDLREKGYDVFDFRLRWNYDEKDEEENTVETKEVNKKVYYVRKHPDGSSCRGVYPTALEFLGSTRKMYKKKMAAAGRKIAELQHREHTPDEMKEAIIEEKAYNQKQLATKIVMNTLYGSIGNKAFNLYNVYLASTITLFGQKAITTASDIATQRGYTRLYGDSVIGNTPIIVRVDGHIVVTRIDELSANLDWSKRDDASDKDYIDLTGVDVWERDCFVKVNQIIRHHTQKPIVRVMTRTGFVDVTPDHSLYNAKGDKISPNDVEPMETELMTSQLELLVKQLESNPDSYNLKLIHELGVSYGDLTATNDSIITNIHNERIIPRELLYSDMEVIAMFMKGFLTTNYHHSQMENTLLVGGKECAMVLSLMLTKLGYTHITVIGAIDKQPKQWYRISYAESRPEEEKLGLVTNKYVLFQTYNNYVYDLNTESGKHHAGLGDIVVSNTDSIFLLPKKELLGPAVEPRDKVTACQRMAEKLLVDILAGIRVITKRESNVLDMELDKLLYPALYCGKKKYYAIIWEGDREPEEYISGLEFKKRGKSQLLRDLSQRVVTESMEFSFNKDMLEFVVDVLHDGVEEIKRKPIDYFIKQTKYRPGKQGSANMFIARMHEKEKMDPVLYQVPDPGVTFEYILTASIDPYMSDGRKRNMKKTDQWEFRHVVERLKMKPDYLYYLDDVIGSLARFINYYPQFKAEEGDIVDMDAADKKSQKNAEKYLRTRLLEFSDSTQLKHTIIKRQRKFINSIYVKIFSGLTDYLTDAYDHNIDIDGVVEYIISSTSGQRFPIQISLSREEVQERLRGAKQYVLSKAGLIGGLYREYVGRLDDVSREQKDMLSISFEYNGREKPTDIIDAINDIIKYQSVLSRMIVYTNPVEEALDIVFSQS